MPRLRQEQERHGHLQRQDDSVERHGEEAYRAGRQKHGLRREAADRAAFSDQVVHEDMKHWSFEVARATGTSR